MIASCDRPGETYSPGDQGDDPNRLVVEAKLAAVLWIDELVACGRSSRIPHLDWRRHPARDFGEEDVQRRLEACRALDDASEGRQIDVCAVRALHANEVAPRLGNGCSKI